MTTPGKELLISVEIRSIGHVESPLVDREAAPKQGFEGAPDAWLVFDPAVAEGIRDLEAFDGTPIVDVKPVLREEGGRR